MIMNHETMRVAAEQNHATYVRDAQTARKMDLSLRSCRENGPAVGPLAMVVCRMLGFVARALLSTERAVVHLRRRIMYHDAHIPSHHVDGVLPHH